MKYSQWECEWSPSAKPTEGQITAPCYGDEVSGSENSRNLHSVKEVFRWAATHKGIQIFEKSRMLEAILDDLLPEDDPENRKIHSGLSLGISEKFFRFYKQKNGSLNEYDAGKFKKSIEECGLSPDLAAFTAEVFFYGVSAPFPENLICRDSDEKESKQKKKTGKNQRAHTTIVQGEKSLYAVLKDGTVAELSWTGEKGRLQWKMQPVSGWENIVDLAYADPCLFGLREDGTVLSGGNVKAALHQILSWKNVVKLYPGPGKGLVGLCADGTVLSAGIYTDTSREISQWKEIEKMDCSSFHMAGISKDGDVLAAGLKQNGRCAVECWPKLSQILTPFDGTVGLGLDGKVYTTQNQGENSPFAAWENIQKLVALPEGGAIWGLTKEGTVRYWGPRHLAPPADWQNIGNIFLFGWGICAVQRDGTLLLDRYGYQIADGNPDPAAWKNVILAFQAADTITAVHEDGRISSSDPQCEKIWSQTGGIRIPDQLLESGIYAEI